MQRRAKVLTVSTGAARGEREDLSGAALEDLLVSHDFDVIERRIVPDGREPVTEALLAMVSEFAGLVVTTGGTGFSPDDLTPEATLAVVEREAPGLAEAMRAVDHRGALSRGRAGTAGTALVLNLPGSPGGATECLAAVVDLLPHALELLEGGRPH